MKRGGIEISAISSLILALAVAIAFVIVFLGPLFKGPLLAKTEGYCMVTEHVKGRDETDLTVDFGRIYDAEVLYTYVTPGGETVGGDLFMPDRIMIKIYTGSGEPIDNGYADPGPEDVHTRMRCIGKRATDPKDQCGPYNGSVKAVSAIGEGDWGGEGGIWNYVDELEVIIFYRCEASMTIINDTCDTTNKLGLGWDYKYPIDCKFDKPFNNGWRKSSPCAMKKGDYAIKNFTFVRQMSEPPALEVKVGARAGCAGIQTGCNLKVYFANYTDCNTCPEWDNVSAWEEKASFSDLDYDYIFFKDRIQVAKHVFTECDKGDPMYHRWCIKIDNSDDCWVNSVWMAPYV